MGDGRTGDGKKSTGARFGQLVGEKVAKEIAARVQRRGSAAMESFASFVGASSGVLKDFADWASKKMKAAHATFTNLKEELDAANTTEGKEAVMEQAAEFAAKTVIEGFVQAGENLTRKQEADVRQSMRASVRLPGGIDGLEQVVHDDLQAVASGKAKEVEKKLEHSGQELQPPPPPGPTVVKTTGIPPKVPNRPKGYVQPKQAQTLPTVKEDVRSVQPTTAPVVGGAEDQKALMKRRGLTSMQIEDMEKRKGLVGGGAALKHVSASNSTAATEQSSGKPINPMQAALDAKKKAGGLKPTVKEDKPKAAVKPVHNFNTELVDKFKEARGREGSVESAGSGWEPDGYDDGRTSGKRDKKKGPNG